MFRRLFEGSESRVIRDPAWAQWAAGTDIGMQGNTYAGVSISPDKSMEAAPILGCSTLISDIMATMDVRQFTKSSGKTTDQMVTWLDEPNRATDWPSWMFDATMGWLKDQELFLTPLRDGGKNGPVRYIAAIDSNRVTVLPGGDSYQIDGKPYTGEIMHRIKYRKHHSDLRSTSLAIQAKEIIGNAVGAQRYGSAFLGQSAVPPVVLELQGQPTPSQMKEIRESWRRLNGGYAKAGLPALLINGTAKPLMVNPEQAQFLETRRFIAAEISTNLFHLPPDVVGVGVDGSSIMYQNLQSKWADIIRSGVMPWKRRWEAIFNRLMPNGQNMCFLPDSYQQADTYTRFQAWQIALAAEFMTVEEVRKQENLVGNIAPKPLPVAPASPPEVAPPEDGNQ